MWNKGEKGGVPFFFFFSSLLSSSFSFLFLYRNPCERGEVRMLLWGPTHDLRFSNPTWGRGSRRRGHNVQDSFPLPHGLRGKIPRMEGQWIRGENDRVLGLLGAQS